ncbi:Fis family transcriptional regulator [Solemya velesiana gill symbiont]|uniref:Fis family transcriptional regulator n=2 Tax=Solemya velesiana gill symbiont TaxID=1918948 RepID=A0A1T2KXN4_9GAMM|nr:Fis family transcriptional regulator [Solemya velesiana gill symbiont]
MSIPGSDRLIDSGMAQLLDTLEEPAILLSPDYRVLAANRCYRRNYEGREVLGRYCYEISHGSTKPCSGVHDICPLKGGLELREPQRVLHIHHSPRGDEHVEVEGRAIFDEDSGDLLYYIEIIRHSRAASAHVDEEGMVGRSEAFNRMLELVQRVAPSETAALLLGESGTGKELVAQAIHDLSPRNRALFVPVECSGLTESLFESQLFGHEKGAFTGAHAAKTGLVESARGGTLFLDEIGDIPLPLQVKLLRLLETGTYRRVGSVDPQQADFRLVCATHRDLKQMVEEGRFRQDLYYRISTFPIELPSLQARIDDLPLLAASLLKRIKVAEGKRLSSDAIACLSGYAFPGNIRELRNILERAALMADGDEIRPEHLPDECRRPYGAGEFSVEAEDGLLSLEEVERRYLEQASKQFGGDRKALAERLGISERTLFRKLQKARS